MTCAYTRPIPKPRCRCGNVATVQVVDSRHVPRGSFCQFCGTREARKLNLEETLTRKTP